MSTDVRSWKQRAARRWRHAAWIDSDGQFALLAPCSGRLTVTLWPTPEDAEAARLRLNSTLCGAGCFPAFHHITRVDRAG